MLNIRRIFDFFRKLHIQRTYSHPNPNFRKTIAPRTLPNNRYTHWYILPTIATSIETCRLPEYFDELVIPCSWFFYRMPNTPPVIHFIQANTSLTETKFSEPDSWAKHTSCTHKYTRENTKRNMRHINLFTTDLSFTPHQYGKRASEKQIRWPLFFCSGKWRAPWTFFSPKSIKFD